MVEQLGYSKEISVWCSPCGGKETNPKLMKSDQELLDMIVKIMKLNRVLACFVHHKKEVQVEAVGVEVEKELQVEAQGVDAEKEVQVEGVENEVQVEEAENEVQVEEADNEVQVEEADNEAEKEVQVDSVDEVQVDDMDFYDPNNDVEADDIDVNFERNVIDEIIRRDWIVPYKNQLEPLPTEEDSDYAPSDVLISGGETDDEDTRRRYPEFNAPIDMKNPQFQVGMIFASFEEFKTAIKEYAIKQRRNVQFKRNDTIRVNAVCKKGCPWNIWVSHMRNRTNNVQVKIYNPCHTCTNENNIKFLTVQWLVNHYLDTFRADPNWSISGIQARIITNLNLQISRQKK